MGLQLAFNTAQSALATTSGRISVSSRNVAAASDPAAARKIAVTTTAADGSTRIVTIARASDDALFGRMLGAGSAAAGLQAVSDGLAVLAQTVGDTQDPTSPAARLGTLKDALAGAANTPDDPTLAQSAVTAAQDLATALNGATTTVQTARSDADGAIATSVARVNDLLGQFQTENTAIVKGTANGADVTDALDRRDAILTKLSAEMGISTVTRANNDMVIYADGGATLFETTARTVSFTPSNALDAATAGHAVYVDGVAVTGADAAMPLQSGRIAGLTRLRDDIAPTYQSQLDEMARGLVSAFAETDQSGAGGPAQAGLFQPATGSTGVPAALVPGLAGRIVVNAAVDPTQGGALARLRDGGMNGAAYAFNAGGAASFAGRLEGLQAAVEAERPVDGAAGLATAQSLTDLGTASVSWLQGQRQATASRLDGEQAVAAQATTALSAVAGVNLDQEYADQLNLERSYQASSKLMGVVNQLYDSLFALIG